MVLRIFFELRFSSKDSRIYHEIWFTWTDLRIFHELGIITMVSRIFQELRLTWKDSRIYQERAQIFGEVVAYRDPLGNFYFRSLWPPANTRRWLKAFFVYRFSHRIKKKDSLLLKW